MLLIQFILLKNGIFIFKYNKVINFVNIFFKKIMYRLYLIKYIKKFFILQT